ncbi:MAG: hypothetical protein KAY37_02610 [Phycisphaerae bacterium]|nr:hypothetical protein [Phycisphaerae bacterium]
MALPKLLKDLMSLPTAPFLESAVMDYVERTCRKLAGVKIKYDRYGNLLAHYRRQPRKITPLAFVAHTDHPGFAALKMVQPRTLRAEFRGGVRPEYFAGSKVRFWNNGQWVKGRVLKLSKTLPPKLPGGPRVPKEAHIQVGKPIPPNTLGMWDLPEPTLRGDRVVSRACDDLAGVAAMLMLLQRLCRKRARGEVYCLFTRAEEVGFVGAVGAIRARTIPKRVPVISIETSSALINAPIGDGPIIRIGDRVCVYTPQFATFCVRVAQELAGRRKSFQYQRKLMDGGMCEAAAFGAYGYAVIGICLALGNYHNMDTHRRKIGSEWVSFKDWQGMVDLFEALVLDPDGPDAVDDSLRTRIDGLFEENQALLRQE